MPMKSRILISVALLGLALGCTKGLSDRIDSLAARIAALEKDVAAVNANTSAMIHFRDTSLLITDYKATEGGYTVTFSDGSVVTIVYGNQLPPQIPIIGLDAEGYWIMSYDGGATFTRIPGAAPANQEGGHTPVISVDSEGYWTMSLDGGVTFARIIGPDGKPISATNPALPDPQSSFFQSVTVGDGYFEVVLLSGETLRVPLDTAFGISITHYSEGMLIHPGETLVFPVAVENVSACKADVQDGWYVRLTDEELTITAPTAQEGDSGLVRLYLVSGKGHLKVVELSFTYSHESEDASACQEWKEFKGHDANNVLLDFSYAGYNHGESAPAAAEGLGYTTYNICDYGAIASDGVSDREAFLALLRDIFGAPSVSDRSITFPAKEHARAIVYFPEGDFILHTSADNQASSEAPEGAFTKPIIIRAGDFILKGAGRGKTRLVMQDDALPTSNAMYSSPEMIQIKHNSGLSSTGIHPVAPAAKGEFTVEVSSTATLSAGDWMCLSTVNKDPDYVAAEVAPYTVTSSWAIAQEGVTVYDYHQIKSISGRKVTFYEPLMHAVEASSAWELLKYPHYENVGVEDLTFKGNAKADFHHHGGWKDDGAFKPLSMVRVVNSWVRRVDFDSVSEAFTVNSSANLSIYDIEIKGHRGHAALRSASSSRVFIGATYDHTDGPSVEGSVPTIGAGQYHAVGVSKPALGTVLWRNSWGSDSCFESHATQPRATLIDCCKGGWMRSRQGGDDSQMPNHLADLTIWNFRSTTPYKSAFVWWDHASLWWKFLPPVIVGFHGESCNFVQDQVTRDSSHGTEVLPESLYESQLKLRLGYVPSWLTELKALGFGK